MKRLLPRLALACLLLTLLSPLASYSEERQAPSAARKARSEGRGTAAAGDAQTSESGKKPAVRRHTGRAILESLALITGSTVDYWRTYANFKEDWQFKFTWADQQRRFFTAESPKFDSNSFWFNWSHAFSGAGYYNMARTNGLNNRASFLFSVGLSALWETVCEWREIISTNDMIFTSFGGPAIGEPFFQVASYFSHRKGLLNRLAGVVFNPFLAANNGFDRRSGAAANSGPDAAWHRFSLFAGLLECVVSPAGTTAVPESVAGHREFNVGLEMETNTVPGYGLAGSFRRSLSDALSSRIFFDLSISPDGLEEFQFRTQAVLFGVAWQSLQEEPDGAVRGRSASLGLGTAFEVFRKRPGAWYDGSAEVPGGGPALSDARFVRPTPTRFTDKMSVISPLGAELALSFFGPRSRLRWTSGAYGDFSMVNALAYNRYTEAHDPGGVKSTLLNWGYYYGLGVTLSTDLALDWRQWRIRGASRYQVWGSIQGQDRYQFLGVVTDDFKLRDDRLVWSLRVGYRIPSSPVELGLTAEGISRHGRILDIREYYQEHRFLYQLRVVF